MVIHGFIYDGTAYTTLDYPGSTYSILTGIDGGRIVGAYRDSSGILRGFAYENGAFQTINPPNASNSTLFESGSGARGVSGPNIVGGYAVDVGEHAQWHSFLYDGANYATFDYPGATESFAQDIDGNRIVGFYVSAGGYHSYYYDGSNFETIDDPSMGINHVSARGISGNKIVGDYYLNGLLGLNGFIYEAGAYTTFKVPLSNAGRTQIAGISGNTIVGVYGVIGESLYYSHGFVATIPEPSDYLLWAYMGAIVLLRGSRRRQQ
jgi:hypothetical protein